MTTVNVTSKSKSKPKLTNHVAIALDSSGSMNNVRAAAVKAFNRNLKDLQEQAKGTGQKTTLTLIVFGDPNVRVAFRRVPIENVERMDYADFTPNSGTPLYDAAGLAIEELHAFPEDKDTSYLIIVITDGGENASHSYSASKLSMLIRSRIATDRWTFAFQVPRGSAAGVAGVLGLPAGNVIEWDQTDRGVEAASTANSVGLRSYFQARASGTRSVSNFYTTDLSGVKKKDLKALVDVTSQVKIWPVDKESEIKPFAERKNGFYTTGAGYYQLMKTEKIQHYKQVLIQDKATGKVYAGEEARELIGLSPSTDRIDGKVTPGNHSNFEIFIQSTSSNRKLPRGTKLAYRLDHTSPSQPTWVDTGVRKGTRTRR